MNDPSKVTVAFGDYECEGFVEEAVSEYVALPDMQITLYAGSRPERYLWDLFAKECWVPFSGYGGPDCETRVMAAKRPEDPTALGVVFTLARRVPRTEPRTESCACSGACPGWLASSRCTGGPRHG